MHQLYHATQLPLFVLTRICKSCKSEKPIEDFYRDRNGYKWKCKSCTNRDITQRQSDRQHIDPPAFKKCCLCGKVKSIEKFGKDKYRPDGYEIRCKECISKKDKAFRQAHPEKDYVNGHAYYYAHHEERLAKMRMYGPLYHALHPEKAHVRGRRWDAANPLRRREKWMRYSARKRNATVDSVNYATILESYGSVCHICSQAIDITIKSGPRRLHFDHIIPLARHGTHSQENILPAHGVCNDRKGVKLLTEMTAFQRRGVDLSS